MFGALAVIPALSWEAPYRDLLQGSNSLPVQLALSFLVVGLGEEFFKLLAVYLAVGRAEEFSEPMDGILYAIAGGIGFSVVENVLYILAFGLAAAPLRGTAASLAHIAFSGLAGYYLGRARFGTKPLRTAATGVGGGRRGPRPLRFPAHNPSGVSPVVVLLIAGLQYLLFAAIGRAVRLPSQR